MKFKTYKSSELTWSLDFKPLKKWPEILPVIALIDNGSIKVISGFERQIQDQVDVLIIDSPLNVAFEQVWPNAQLGGLERLRLLKVLGQSTEQDFLLEWPVELQYLLDQKQVALKSLKPLEYLTTWKDQLSSALIALRPSSSQCREVLDLLCDLKMSGLQWGDCQPEIKTVFEASHWMTQLKTLRNPNTLQNDSLVNKSVMHVPWPRGVSAKWERQGDQASIVIQAKVNNKLEWKRLTENLQKTELGDQIWNS
ncbi:MAG: hypothetical protein SGI74_01140 [Oligoflexia bacterium]|nr:hypothetical protein [Oligoflexia bacterium]